MPCRNEVSYARAQPPTWYQLGWLPAETISLASGLLFVASNWGGICFLQLYYFVYHSKPLNYCLAFSPLFCSLALFFFFPSSFFSLKEMVARTAHGDWYRVFLNAGNISSNYTVQTWRLYYLKLPGMMPIYQTSCKKFISAVKRSLLSPLASFIEYRGSRGDLSTLFFNLILLWILPDQWGKKWECVLWLPCLFYRLSVQWRERMYNLIWKSKTVKQQGFDRAAVIMSAYWGKTWSVCIPDRRFQLCLFKTNRLKCIKIHFLLSTVLVSL